MAKKIPDIRFELHKVYKTYVDQLDLAANVSDILLGSSNMDSAGEQVEGSFRILLKSLLPERVSVTHGYIVDKSSKISYQQDVLIAESFYTKSLIKTLDGTEFYPYEAIFACAEVKKTWSQSKLTSAIKSIKHNREVLKRYQIPADHISTGSNFIMLNKEITSNACRNPLFSFTFSTKFDNTYSEELISEVLNNPENAAFLPNISVVLGQGIFICVDEDQLKSGNLSIKLYPEFRKSGDNYKWVFVRLEPEESLAYLIFMLTQHINDTILEKVSAMEYAATMITIPMQNLNHL